MGGTAVVAPPGAASALPTEAGQNAVGDAGAQPTQPVRIGGPARPARIAGPAASEGQVGAGSRSEAAARPNPASRSDAGSRAAAAVPRHGPRPAVQAATTDQEAPGQKASCTLAQMRRFIKSRPYVPVHELRRRFLIDGIEDEVSPMTVEKGTLYVGLPEREAGFLGELVKSGEVGCELLLDPTSPAVVGVFPMRPVARQ